MKLLSSILLLIGVVQANATNTCFQSNTELRRAVRLYAAASDAASSATAQTYGFPIGTWCFDEKLTDFSHVFEGVSSFNEPIGAWNVSQALTMHSMFRYASSFNQPLNSWQTSNVVNMHAFMDSASSFNQDLNGLDTSSVTRLSRAFRNTAAFDPSSLDWNTSRVTTFFQTFQRSRRVRAHVLSGWDTSSATDFSFMFHLAAGLADNDTDSFSRWDVSRGERFESMFHGTRFSGNLSTWNVSAGESFRNMFRDNAAFDQDLSSWAMTSATDLIGMFDGATQFNHTLCAWQDPLLGRHLAAVDMFRGTACPAANSPVSYTPLAVGPLCTYCSSFPCDDSLEPSNGVDSQDEEFNENACMCFAPTKALQRAVDDYLRDESPYTPVAKTYGPNISNWCTKHVQNMDYVLDRAYSFNGDISRWDTSSCVSMIYAFRRAIAFDQPLNAWNVSRVRSMRGMFEAASVFNQDLSDWDTSSLFDARDLFLKAESFNQDLSSSWNLARTKYLDRMFSGATAFDQDSCSQDWISTLLVSRPSMTSMFAGTSCPAKASTPYVTPNQVGPLCHYCSDMPCNHPNHSQGCIGIKNGPQFRAAIQAYLQDESEKTAVAGTYGFPIGEWDTSELTDFRYAFKNYQWISRSLDIGRWNTSRAEKMTSMFENAVRFDCDLSSWDVSRVQTFNKMFQNARGFNADISSWSMKSAIFAQNMFADAKSFNQNLCAWQTNGFPASRIRRTDGMFAYTKCPEKTSPAKNGSGPYCHDCSPTVAPTMTRTDLPSLLSSAMPSPIVSSSPSTPRSSSVPSVIPSSVPSQIPSDVPSQIPSESPSLEPSTGPSGFTTTTLPTLTPTDTPTNSPTNSPTVTPTGHPTNHPTNHPTVSPSKSPEVSKPRRKPGCKCKCFWNRRRCWICFRMCGLKR